MYIIVISVLVILTILSVYFYIIPKNKKQPKTEKEQLLNRCSTKCFDCVNNNQSLNRLNVSHGCPRVYAT